MAQDKRNEQRGQEPREGAGTGVTGPTSEDRSDRERSIETRREGETARALNRAPLSSAVQGTGRTPFSLVRTMMDDMDRLFSGFGFSRGLESGLWGNRSEFARAVWAPQVETFRRGDKLVIRADLPGLKRDDVTVNVEDDVLAISGERRDEHEEDRDGYYRSERSYGQFYRAIALPEGVNADDVDASFKDGVLEVTIPAPKETTPRRKRVQVR